MTRLYVCGGPGSGKTTYAKQLAKQLNVPCFDLDEFKWINRPDVFNLERPKEERIALLNKAMTENKDWILEGVYYQGWILPVIDQADKVIVLMPPLWVRQWRIIKRSFRRMLHIDPKKHRENPFALWKLLAWSREYEMKYLPQLIDTVRQKGKECEIITQTGKK